MASSKSMVRAAGAIARPPGQAAHAPHNPAKDAFYGERGERALTDRARQAARRSPAPRVDVIVAEQGLMRDRIKAAATELLIRHGYRGMSFGDIAPLLETTRANIHYHFGNKQKLLEEILEDYVDNTLAHFRRIWTDESRSFEDKVEATIAFNRKRYARFNTGRANGRPWSLIARMRNDNDVIGEYANKALSRFARELSTYISEATGAAIRRGEFEPDAPVEDIVILLVSIANSAGPITQDAGDFERLAELYRAFLRTAEAAYAGKEPGHTR
jgi:AcrR family transcriptional regulator